MKTKKSPWARVALYLFVFVICIIILYPYFVMLTTAAKSNEEMYATGEAAVLLPSVWQWSNFIDIWREAAVFKYLLNSIIVAGGATCLAILCGIPAAYALSRMRFKGKGIFMGAVIMSQMFSPPSPPFPRKWSRRPRSTAAARCRPSCGCCCRCRPRASSLR